MLQKVLYTIGAILVIVGVWGYFQNPVLGLFAVDGIHNLVHLVTGVVLILAGFAGQEAAKWTAIVFGIVYALVALIGFLTGGDSILNIFVSNMADDILHVAIAAVLLYFGFAGGGMSAASGGGMSAGGGGQPQQPQGGGQQMGGGQQGGGM